MEEQPIAQSGLENSKNLSTNTKKSKHWWIVTPQYYTYYQDEPPDFEADVVCVEADTKRKALVKGVQELRKIRRGYLTWNKGNEESPFTGLKAERAECPHGNCWCDICSKEPEWNECSQCLAEWDALDKQLEE